MRRITTGGSEFRGFADPEASKFIYGSAFHGYEGTEHGNVTKLHDLYPDKPIFFTEFNDHPWHVPDYSFLDGQLTGRFLVNDLRNWCSAWIFWNMVLNENGGPSHDTWQMDSLTIVNEQTGDVAFEGEYYYLAHFSRFVRPGARRIAVETQLPHLLVIGFQNPDSRVVIIAMNTSDDDHSACVGDGERSFNLCVPALGIVSCRME